ncbi:glycosyltransferase family 2 protein [Bizionia hallyeonensis]|uniref:Glycosyltransferase family 2 protein n=1 Tax=Bizionia hallyeonensis TaxID=1123757 RepID=A0ABW0C881_9FLAO
MSFKDTSVVIIVVTYNGMPWIDACLRSCQNYPVIVIDNQSTDGTVRYIQTHFEEVLVFEQDRNLGFGQANNLGITKALALGFENVFLLNQDAYLGAGCLDVLMEAAAKNSEYGILSPIHLNGSGLDYDTQFFKYATIAGPHLPSEFNKLGVVKSLFQVPYINAAAWFVTKNCLEQVGGFDPLFFHYGEDNNYCQRVRYSGLSVGVVTHAFVRHDRESRPKLIVEPGSVIYFDRLERKLKSRYGDITQANFKDLKQLQYKRFKEFIKAMLRFQLTEARIKIQEVLLIKRLLPLIQASRTRNSTQTIKRYLCSN